MNPCWITAGILFIGTFQSLPSCPQSVSNQKTFTGLKQRDTAGGVSRSVYDLPAAQAAPLAAKYLSSVFARYFNRLVFQWGWFSWGRRRRKPRLIEKSL